jgi:hypothetical protein
MQLSRVLHAVKCPLRSPSFSYCHMHSMKTRRKTIGRENSVESCDTCCRLRMTCAECMGSSKYSMITDTTQTIIRCAEGRSAMKQTTSIRDRFKLHSHRHIKFLKSV